MSKVPKEPPPVCTTDWCDATNPAHDEGIHWGPKVSVADFTIQPCIQDNRDNPGYEPQVFVDDACMSVGDARALSRAITEAAAVATTRQPEHGHHRMWCVRYDDGVHACDHRDDSVHEGEPWSTGTLTKTYGEVGLELYESDPRGATGYTLLRLEVTDREQVEPSRDVLLTEDEAERLIVGLQRTISRIKWLRESGLAV